MTPCGVAEGYYAAGCETDRFLPIEVRMPKIFRVMAAEGNVPMIGQAATTLGVRVPRDIASDAAGRVYPETGGMSVSPSLADLPPHRIPKRLRHLAPDAAGKNAHFVWSMGEGAFTSGPVDVGLQLRPDPKNRSHGLVEPDGIMLLENYLRAIHATQPKWSVDEE
jgi:hypothetical protein